MPPSRILSIIKASLRIKMEGAYDLTFRIYDVETAGNPLWEEIDKGVAIQKGVFAVFLGGLKNLDLPFDKQYFLEIQVGSEVMSPRQRITSAGYAYMAENAQSLAKGSIILWSGSITAIPSKRRGQASTLETNSAY